MGKTLPERRQQPIADQARPSHRRRGSGAGGRRAVTPSSRSSSMRWLRPRRRCRRASGRWRSAISVSGSVSSPANREEAPDALEDVAAVSPTKHAVITEKPSVAGSRPASSHARSSARLPIAQLVVRRAEGVHLGRVARGERGEARLDRAAEDERRVRLLHRPRERLLIAQRVRRPVVVEALLRPRADDDLDLLGEQLEPLPARRGTGTRAPRARARTSRSPSPPRRGRPRCGRRSTAIRARTLGWRNVAGETIVPSRMRSVTAASPASVAQASCASRVGRG